MSDASLNVAGVLLITVPLVAFGGVRLLSFIWGRTPGYLDEPVRQKLWRAGHAHAGVLVILALLCMLCVDRADMSDTMKTVVRSTLVAAPILMPLGFFLSMASPRSERPNGILVLVPLGGISLAVGAVILGVALLGT